jgi:hydroxymethylbilane synthase
VTTSPPHRPRADTRDVLLVKRAGSTVAIKAAARAGPPPRAAAPIYPAFLQWALPVKAPRASRSCSRAGDCEARLAQLMDGDAHALVVAKANIDRPARIDAPEFAAFRCARARRARGSAKVMVLPLALNPTAPGQGALALEIRRDRGRSCRVVRPRQRRGRLRPRASPSARGWRPPAMKTIRSACPSFPCIAARSNSRAARQAGQWIQNAELRRHDSPLPPAANPHSVWTGDEGSADRYRRVALQVRHDQFADARVGLFVARSEAWPDGYLPRPGQVVWTAGIDTWRRLAARGIWVHGSDESLGEGGVAALKTLFPRVQRWVKFSHDLGFDSHSASGLRLIASNGALPWPIFPAERISTGAAGPSSTTICKPILKSVAPGTVADLAIHSA